MRRKKEKKLNYELIQALYEYKEKKVSYIDALVEIHSIYGADMDDMSEMLPDEILEEIRIEFAGRNMIKDEKLKDKSELRSKIDNLMSWLE